MQINTLTKLAASLLLCGLTAHAGAQTVVFDSYGDDITYLDGWPQTLEAGNSIAVQFSLASATTVQSILTAIEHVPEWGGSGGVTLGIVTRNGALPGGASWLHSAHLDAPAVNTTFTPTGWALAAGSYWLVATADSGFAGQWIGATYDYTGNWAYTTAPGAWTEQSSTFLGMPGARITVAAAVPEPATYGLMLVGGLLVAAAARRKSATRPQG